MPSGSFGPTLSKLFNQLGDFVSTHDTCQYFIKLLITSKIVATSHEH